MSEQQHNDEQPEPPGRTKRVKGLESRIAESRQLRALVRDPDLLAVRIDGSRRRTLAGLWFFLALGLAFTTAGVQDFLAGDRPVSDPMWWAAWAVEPMFAGLLIVLLNFEATILAHGVEPDSDWWSRIKAVLLSSTLFMNVAPQLAPLFGTGTVNVGSLAVHAIIPVVVYALAEVIPVIQARARRVILDGYAAADHTAPAPATPAPTKPREATQPEPAPSSSRAQAGSASTPAEPAPAPAPALAGSSESVRAGSVKLPPQVADKLRALRDEVAHEGRELTTADVQQAVRVPDEMAARIVAEFATRNGAALT